ncbi:hypothetical protein BD626DRAFT_506820 [Schizophyllum amplum]|uniref:Uncharacterized protein n=1 Tax=Schizophyllum amplum TaxID=97359 RepID=A0A550C546_9AGAR|nr:hypothetical protein BD626DRAFT_506820 [Auriculariopsis ampla]
MLRDRRRGKGQCQVLFRTTLEAQLKELARVGWAAGMDGDVGPALGHVFAHGPPGPADLQEGGIPIEASGPFLQIMDVLEGLGEKLVGHPTGGEPVELVLLHLRDKHGLSAAGRELILERCGWVCYSLSSSKLSCSAVALTTYLGVHVFEIEGRDADPKIFVRPPYLTEEDLLRTLRLSRRWREEREDKRHRLLPNPTADIERCYERGRPLIAHPYSTHRDTHLSVSASTSNAHLLGCSALPYFDSEETDRDITLLTPEVIERMALGANEEVADAGSQLPFPQLSSLCLLSRSAIPGRS